MKYLIFFAPLIFIILTNFSYSKSLPPVKHSHDGRVHTHSLPNNGKGTHHHGKGQKRQKSIPHSHNGRKHSHPLPESGVNHNHSGQSPSSNKPSTTNETSADGKTNATNGASADVKTNATDETSADGKTSATNETSADVKINATDETSADGKISTTLTQEQIHFNNFMENTGLLTIVNRRNFNKFSDGFESKAYPYYYYWYPEGFDNTPGINGLGELRFKIYPNGWENGSSAIKIESDFKNGKPVGNGKLTVSELSKTYSSAKKEISISPESNIKDLIMESFNITETTESD